MAAVIAAPPAAAPRQFVLCAMRGPDVKVDGDVSEWPWQDATRVIRVEQDLNGDVLDLPKGRACATWDTETLCLGLHFAVAEGTGEGDLVEISLRSRSVNNATVFGVKLEVEVPPGLTLRSGYSAVARIELARVDGVLVIPERLVDYRDGGAFVLIGDGGSGTLEKEIGAGLSDGLTVEITEGLAEGDEVLERVF